MHRDILIEQERERVAVAQAQRRMQADHEINQAAATTHANCVGGWTVDSNGDRYYKQGYF